MQSLSLSNPKINKKKEIHQIKKTYRPEWNKPKKLKYSNLFQRQLTNLKIKKMNYNSKYHLLVKTMLFTWVWSILDLQFHNQQMLYLILVQSILQSQVVFVMMRPLDNTDLKSLIQIPRHSLREIKNQRGARLWLTTCRSLIAKRFYQRPPLS